MEENHKLRMLDVSNVPLILRSLHTIAISSLRSHVTFSIV